MARSHKQDFLSHQGSGSAQAAQMPLRELIHDYLEEVEIQGKAAITSKHYGACLATFTDWLAFQTRRSADELTTADIDQERLRMYQLFLARRRHARTGRPIVPATRNVYVSALRGLLKYARSRRGLDAPDPEATLLRARERDVEIRRLGRDEVQRLREGVDLSTPTGLRDRTIIEALFGSAVRVSELASMTVRGTDLRRREVQMIGKGSKSRLVLLTQEAAAWIERYLATRRDDSPALFVTAKPKEVRALGVRQIQRIVERAAVRAGLPVKVSPHWLRHSRLTIVARSGVEVAQRIAGHSSLQTTARYLHVTDAQLRSIYDQADEADRDAQSR